MVIWKMSSNLVVYDLQFLGYQIGDSVSDFVRFLDCPKDIAGCPLHGKSIMDIQQIYFARFKNKLLW